MTSRATSRAQTAPKVTVLIVLAPETSALPSILRHSNWEVNIAHGFEEAVARVRHSPPAVVIAPHRAGGALAWPKLLDVLARSSVPSRLIVTDRCTDDATWAEALCLGAYDVLPQPLHSAEVFRTITEAWNSSQQSTRRAHARDRKQL